MKLGNAAFELADQRAEQEREAGVQAARHFVGQRGSPICIDCGEPIEEARRAAAPFARRCIDCAKLSERRG